VWFSILISNIFTSFFNLYFFQKSRCGTFLAFPPPPLTPMDVNEWESDFFHFFYSKMNCSFKELYLLCYNAMYSIENFVGTCHLHLQGQRKGHTWNQRKIRRQALMLVSCSAYSLTLKMEVTCSLWNIR
jgi:hypothetical protein